MKRLQAIRDAYARQVTAHTSMPSESSRLFRAFATVKRENFLGPGPWQVQTRAGYVSTPANLPECLYQDVLVALDTSRQINNGQPSLHASSIAALRIETGHRIIHVGAGSGYYTAILSEMTGNTGSVDAFEIDPALSELAAQNLSAYPTVKVHHASGVSGPLPSSNAIYVSAGATHPSSAWLEALQPNGVLVFPLTASSHWGGMLCLQKSVASLYTAKFLTQVSFIPCQGVRDEKLGLRLEDAFNRGDFERVQSLRLQGKPDSSCWFAADDWWLSTAPID